jgi:uncharacterized BrkB/YihY/UPF0761 family membrane protein
MDESPRPDAPNIVDRARDWGQRHARRTESWLGSVRERVEIVDVGARVYERDKEAGGTLLGSALSLRLFLFFVPLVLVVVGLAGLLGAPSDGSNTIEVAGLSGTLANYVDDAFAQSGRAPWIALLAGLVGVATTGRALTRALVLSSALSWRMGGKQRTPVRVIGIVVGLVVGITLAAAIMNRIKQNTGAAVTSLSMLGLTAVFAVIWLLIYQALPRTTTDPGAALPGAGVVALVTAGLQTITQFYLPHQLSNSADLYGQLGVLIVFLGWFFFLGRTIAFSFALNAVIYEQVGSVSVFVFGLPVIRRIPQRIPALGRYFAVDYVAEGESETPEPTESQGAHRP